MSGLTNFKAIYNIARQEFIQTLTHPIIPVAALIVLIMAILNGAGGAPDLETAAMQQDGDALIMGFGQSWMIASMVCTIMAVFLGATTISFERWNNSLNVLLTKPLYRHDYVVGKFMGLSSFLLLFNTFTLLLFGLTMVLFFRAPQSSLEFTWRLIAYILVLTLACLTVISINILFGMISRNLLFITAASMTYVFFEWIWYSDRVLGPLSILTPKTLYIRTLNPLTDQFDALFNTIVPFGQWFNAILPYAGMLIIELLVLLIAGIFLFTREDKI